MPILSAREVADLWILAGGPPARAVEWVAIALGESSYNTTVVSSAGAIGLWQLMPGTAQGVGFSPAQMYDGLNNARAAVAVSGGGTNCAAWDSCYRDIYASGRYRYLSYPEQGSADWNNIPIVSAELKGMPIGGPAPPGHGGPAPVFGDDMKRAVARLNLIYGTMLPKLGRKMVRQQMISRQMFRKNWRL
jgi:Transglycosylase SLT domain